MYKPGSAITRKQTKVLVWISGGIVIEGFAHLPEGSRESDFFEAKVKSTIALTQCKINYNDERAVPTGTEQQADVLIVNKDQVLFFQPLE